MEEEEEVFFKNEVLVPFSASIDDNTGKKYLVGKIGPDGFNKKKKIICWILFCMLEICFIAIG